MIELFKKNEPLSKHANFRIGGPAKYFFEARSVEGVLKAVSWATQSGENFFVLGGGSNILVSDQGFNGLVIKIASRSVEIKDNRIIADAGAITALVARRSAETGLTGFEWAVSLPGTIGGAVRGNAGCFGGETKNLLVKVYALQIFGNEWHGVALGKEECRFGYRDSVFKHLDPSPVILSAEFQFDEDNPKNCLERINKNLETRKGKQPLVSSSAGCIFKNYELGIKNYDFEIPEEFLKSKQVPAGWLIEQAGIKGLKVGGAEISPKHGNFVLNSNKAIAKDILEIIKMVKESVHQKFGLELHEEIQLVGF